MLGGTIVGMPVPGAAAPAAGGRGRVGNVGAEAGGVVGVEAGGIAAALPGVPPTGWTITRIVEALPLLGAVHSGAFGFCAQLTAGSVLAWLVLVIPLSPPQLMAASAATASAEPSRERRCLGW